MDCGHVRSSIAAYRSGDLRDDESAAVGAHLAACEPCTNDAREVEGVLALLQAAPSTAPSPRVWQALSAELDRDPRTLTPALAGSRRPAGAASFKPWLKLAAAASILVAALSFLYVGLIARNSPVATVSHTLPGSDVALGKTLLANEPFTAATYTVLTLPGVGTLKINKDSAVTFESPRRVRLLQGELFAEITPSGRGFVIASKDASITVHGTRFGVRSDGAPSTIYVLEGRVAVASPAGSLELAGRQMATIGGPAQTLDDEALGWIAANELPTIVMRIESHQKTMTRGSPAAFTLSFRSTSPAPVLLESAKDLPSRIVLKVTDPSGKEYLANLEGGVTSLEARQAPSGLVRVDVSTPAVLSCSCRLQNGFDKPGRYRLSVSYDGSRTPGSPGTVIPSDPITIEVRD